MTQPDLPGYTQESFTHDGETRTVYRRGDGPAVVVIAEIPGITPKVIEFADRVVEIGCSVWLPQPVRDPRSAGDRDQHAEVDRAGVQV